MNKHKNENTLAPRLRFPEFVNDGEWRHEKLGEIGEFTGGGTPSRNNETYWQGDIPWVSSSDIEEESIFSINISRFISAEALRASATKLVPANSILLVSRVGVGKLAITHLPICTSQDFTNFTPNSGDLVYLAYCLKKHKEILLSFSQGMAIKGFTKDDISNLEITLPSINEQQKIAACLSSLDDLITAERQKLEVLKEHKKGLLQNLFPSCLNHDSFDLHDGHDSKNQGNQENHKNQGSDNVPRVRFKEFEESGEWEVKTLGEIGEPLMCKRIFKEETTPNPNNGVPFYKIGTFGRLADAYISKEIYEEYKSKYSFPRIGDILISASGTIGRLVVYDGSPAYFQDSNIIWLGHCEDTVLNCFLFYCYSNLTWQTSDGGVISRLYNSDFKRMKIKHPKNKQEQQKIASVLSSIDELIIAQGKKIEALQLHKKGLLQGLFPNVNKQNG